MESDRRVGFRVGLSVGPREPHFRATSGTRSRGWSRSARVHSSGERESIARRPRIIREKRSGRGYRLVNAITPLRAVVCCCLFGPAGAAPPLLFHLTPTATAGTVIRSPSVWVVAERSDNDVVATVAVHVLRIFVSCARSAGEGDGLPLTVQLMQRSVRRARCRCPPHQMELIKIAPPT